MPYTIILLIIQFAVSSLSLAVVCLYFRERFFQPKERYTCERSCVHVLCVYVRGFIFVSIMLGAMFHVKIHYAKL